MTLTVLNVLIKR